MNWDESVGPARWKMEGGELSPQDDTVLSIRLVRLKEVIERVSVIPSLARTSTVEQNGSPQHKR